jgi:hypothetical protein
MEVAHALFNFDIIVTVVSAYVGTTINAELELNGNHLVSIMMMLMVLLACYHRLHMLALHWVEEHNQSVNKGDPEGMDRATKWRIIVRTLSLVLHIIGQILLWLVLDAVRIWLAIELSTGGYTWHDALQAFALLIAMCALTVTASEHARNHPREYTPEVQEAIRENRDKADAMNASLSAF